MSGTGVALTPAATAFTATPASASFGSVPTGTNVSQTVKLKNTGLASLTISSISASGKGFAWSGIATPLVLGGWEAVNLTLSFAPTTTGYVAGTVSIGGNPADKTLTMTMSGTGVTTARTISATPASLSFGNQNVGSSTTLPVILTNTGNSSFTISGITIGGAGITTSGGVSGATLAAGQSATVDVTFAPKTAGSVNGSLQVTSNATNSPATITVSGDGVSSTSTAHSVALGWDASTSTGIAGYYVYRAVGTGGYSRLVTSLVSGLKYTDTAVVAGTTYKYAVTAVDTAGIESAYSSAVTVTVP
jgi:ribosomal protein S8E